MYETAKIRKDLVAAGLFFCASTLITWWFILAGSGLYASREKMLLSCSIAGGKWALQIVAAWLFLGERKWPFIRRISTVCLVGSLILLPFCFPAIQHMAGQGGFLYSLCFCVAVMILLYYRAVTRSSISIKWFWGWIACLGLAIFLQLTVVFHVL